MAYAIVDGIELCKITNYSRPDGLLADEHYTANGSHRRDVLAMTRTWNITLSRLNADEWAVLYRHFTRHLGRSLFWDVHMGGTYPQNAVPVTVRMTAKNVAGPSRTREGRGKLYWVTENGDYIVTEHGDRILWPSLQPLNGVDYRGGEITLTIKEVVGIAPGGGFHSTAGSEVLLIPGPQGAPGPQGPVGPAGQDGTIITAGPTPPTVGKPGDLHIDTTTGELLEWEES